MQIKPMLLTTALVVAYSSAASAQVSVVNTVVLGVNNPASPQFTFTYTPVTPGNTLVFCTYVDNGTTGQSVTFDGVAAEGFIHGGRSTLAYTRTSDASVSVVVNLSANGNNNGGYVLYELSGVAAGAVELGTGNSIVTSADTKFVVGFGGVNNTVVTGSTPAVGSIITNFSTVNWNGGAGGGGLAYGYGVAGLAGTQTLGWSFISGGGVGNVAAAFPTGVNPDSDGDGLLDVWENNNFGNLTSARGTQAQSPSLGANWDHDADGFDNEAEETASSDPNNIDSIPGDIDGDDFLDADEITYFGNLNQTPDGDFDGDYSTNIVEVNAATSPSNANAWPDIEPDLMADGWEAANGLVVGSDDSALDADLDLASNLAEFQAGSDPQNAAWTPGSAVLAHRWSFTGDQTDSVGGSNAQIANDDVPNVGLSSTQNPTSLSLSGGGKATSDYILLGNNLLSALQSGGVKPVTIELWATQDAVGNWSRIWDFGTDVNGNPGNNGSLRMTWVTGTNVNTDQVEWAGFANSTTSNAPYVPAVPYHIVMTIMPAVFSNGAITQGNRVSWYSAPVSTSQTEGHPLFAAKGAFNTTSDLRALLDSVCYLGRSMFNDATASATYDEVRIWKGGLSETERELFQLIGPDSIDRSDADTDSFPDAWEVARFGNTTTATVSADFDSDGEPDELEFADETDPNDVLSIGADSDLDNLADSWEMQYFRNLLQLGAGDPDSDLVSNEVEETNGTIPTDPNSSPDLDGDGLDDGWENIWFGDTMIADGVTNFDGDFDTDLEEFTGGFDPTEKFSGRDTDTDLLPDYWEFFYFQASQGVNYLVFNGTNDFDNDSSTHASEFADGTDPADANSFKDVNGDMIYDGIQLAATDGFGATSFNLGTNWTGGLAPVAGKNYLVFGQTLRTPDVDNTNLVTVFAGNKLVISSGTLFLKGATSTASANYVLHGGTVRNATGFPGAVTMGGTIDVTGAATSVLWANNGPIVLGAVVSGSSDLSITGTNPVQFNAVNTFSGDLSLSETSSLAVNGSLTVGSASAMSFAPGAPGVSNTVGGTGSIGLNGAFSFNMAGAGTTPGSAWPIVTTATVTYDPAFTVTGFTPDGGAVGSRVWSDGTYEFDEATGVLFLVPGPGYYAWAVDNGLVVGTNEGADSNPDSDPYANVLEYQLGGDPLGFDGNLVTVTENLAGTHLVFTFERYDLSETDSTLNFRWGTDLGIWNTVPIGMVSSPPDVNGVSVTVTEDGGATADYDLIEVQLPKSNESGGRLFGQLEGTQP